MAALRRATRASSESALGSCIQKKRSRSACPSNLSAKQRAAGICGG